MVKAGNVEFLRAQELSEETRRILFEWTPDPFSGSAWGLRWRPKTDHLLVRCEGRLASHAGLIRDTLHVDGQALPVGGIGDVITVPEFQGRGLAKAAVQKAVEIVWHDWALGYAVLFCYPPLRPFYQHNGWTVIEEPVWVAQPGGRIQVPIITMFLSRNGKPWPSGQVDVGGLPW